MKSSRTEPFMGWSRQCLGLTLGLLLASVAWAQEGQDPTRAERRFLEGAWFDQPPYAYTDARGEATGFDIALMREVGLRAGITFTFRQIDWQQAHLLMQQGRLDFGLNAYHVTARDSWGMVSTPYRPELDRLFLRPGIAARITASTPAALFAEVRRLNLRVGVVTAYDYGPDAGAFLREPANGSLIVGSSTDDENASKLATGEIDGFLADELTGYQALADLEGSAAADPFPVPVWEGNVHVLFSRATVQQELVERFNRALADVRADGTYDSLRRSFAAPAILDIAIARGWFRALDWIGTVAFAISGVLLARRERYSVFGALVLAAVPALGGGVVRDLLTSRHPIAILASPVGPLLVVGTVTIGYILLHLADTLSRRYPVLRDVPRLFTRTEAYLPARSVYEAFDAIGLAAFTVTGVFVAIRTGAQPLWIWGPLLAVLTAAGGGILRDVIRSDADNPALKVSLYAEISLIWGLVLSLVATSDTVISRPAHLSIAVVVIITAAFASRLLVVILGLRSPRF